MQKNIAIIFATLSITLVLANPVPDPESTTESGKKRIVHVGIGEHCALGAAPVGPGGSWQVVEKDVEKICAAGTTCRKGACNCDDLPDGSVTSMDSDSQGNRSCKKVAGQKCSSDSECFIGVSCLKGICTCDKKDDYCIDDKNDVIILA